MREPQSVERPKPSAAPVLLAAVVLALCLMLPYLLMSLGYVVIGLVVLLLIARKLPLGGLGLGARRDGQERPRIYVTNFRVGVPKAGDPRAVAAEHSCRLLTRQVDGPVELAGGDTVRITGWRSGGRLVRVQTITVESTQSRLRAASGASSAPTAVTTVVLLALAAAALWANRAWLAPEVLAQAVQVIQQSVVQLLTLVVILAVVWFLVKKVFLRR